MKCAYCEKDAYLGFVCKRCGNYYCSTHRLPENHNCAFKDLSKEQVALKMQFETPPAAQVRTPAVPREERVPQSRIDAKEFDDDDEMDQRFPQGGRAMPVGIDLSMSLLLFVIFLITDLISILYYPDPINLLPIFVDAVFLPVLLYISIKMKRGELPPGGIFLFIKTILTYLVVYIIVKVIADIFTPDQLLSLFITVLVCGILIYFYNRILQQLKAFASIQ